MEKIRPSHDRSAKRTLSRAGPRFSLGLMVLLAGCSAMQLTSFNKQVEQGDWVGIAAQKVACDQSSSVCAELHLIKGEACLHAADSDPAPAGNTACAADELEKGLELMPAWTDAAVHRRYHELYCESLQLLQALQTGPAASRTLSRFVHAAQGLYRLAPDSVPAVYYLASARLRRIQPTLGQINAATRIPACNRLKRTVTGVLSKIETAAEAPPEDWNRFAERYQRLSFDLGSAMREAGCR